jgi:hypothetical protein
VPFYNKGVLLMMRQKQEERKSISASHQPIFLTILLDFQQPLPKK